MFLAFRKKNVNLPHAMDFHSMNPYKNVLPNTIRHLAKLPSNLIQKIYDKNRICLSNTI